MLPVMSMSRRCDFFQAVNDQWYVLLGDHEHAEEESDCTYYGPFPTLEEAEKELDYHSNPGSSWTDRTHKRPVPETVQLPTKERRSRIRYRW